MTPCFADTFFFLALLNSSDPVNRERARAANRVDRPVVTSAWVLLELADHLCDWRNRHLWGEVVRAIRADGRYEVVDADQRLFERASELYLDRGDKGWSLTDCTSFVLMRDRGIGEALTGDHHFEQAGFVVLLK